MNVQIKNWHGQYLRETRVGVAWRWRGGGVEVACRRCSDNSPSSHFVTALSASLCELSSQK